MAARTLTLSALSMMIVSCTEAAETPCAAAAAQVAACTGEPVALPLACVGADASAADAVLAAQGCDELLAPTGKADGFGCTWVGRELGWCHHVASDSEVLYTIGEGSAASLPADGITALVWNVHKGEDPSWDEQMTALSRDAELVLVQEFQLDADSEATFARAPLGWQFATSFFVGGEGGPRTGVATGSTARPTSVQFMRTDHVEPGAETPKMSLATAYAFGDRSLLVVNVHAINFRETIAFSSQVDQIVAAVRGHDGPVLAAGDFNTWAPWRWLLLSEALLDEGLEVVELADDDRDIALDHVFVRGLSVRSAALLHGYPASDHEPIRVELGP